MDLILVVLVCKSACPTHPFLAQWRAWGSRMEYVVVLVGKERLGGWRERRGADGSRGDGRVSCYASQNRLALAMFFLD